MTLACTFGSTAGEGGGFFAGGGFDGGGLFATAGGVAGAGEGGFGIGGVGGQSSRRLGHSSSEDESPYGVPVSDCFTYLVHFLFPSADEDAPV